ncbi:carboxymuconolactone decarboxylase family protein [Mycobacterium sp. E787]|uniref:carboxymuconolactone decarboxylase family protein n=1 Tax=Mycobacterium sp. E787 TaxID=1834150 RepID=UPI0009ED09DA|nr:carboxymuconolactone decarboxylase family protein [Mycobacterium sp. E787]
MTIACEHMNDGVIPAKYRLLVAMAAARPDGVSAWAAAARAAGASNAEIAEAVEIRRSVGAASLPVAAAETSRPRTLRGYLALCVAAMMVGAALLMQTAAPGRADVCGDVGGAQAPGGGCAPPGAPAADPPPQAGLSKPPWLSTIERRDPQFADSYLAMRERILKDGAIPAKYKLLIGMVTDAIAAHPDGVRMLADNARAAGASEPEVTEAVEVGYLYGGTAALVTGSNAFGG